MCVFLCTCLRKGLLSSHPATKFSECSHMQGEGAILARYSCISLSCCHWTLGSLHETRLVLGIITNVLHFLYLLMIVHNVSMVLLMFWKSNVLESPVQYLDNENQFLLCKHFLDHGFSSQIKTLKLFWLMNRLKVGKNLPLYNFNQLFYITTTKIF